MAATNAENADFTTFDEVPWVLLEDQRGYYFNFSPNEDIHAALAYQDLPQGLVRGATAAESGANMRKWLRDLFFAIDPNCLIELPDGTHSCCAFRPLSVTSYCEAMNRINIQGWGAFCLQNSLSCGGMRTAVLDDQGAMVSFPMRQGPFVTN